MRSAWPAILALGCLSTPLAGCGPTDITAPPDPHAYVPATTPGNVLQNLESLAAKRDLAMADSILAPEFTLLLLPGCGDSCPPDSLPRAEVLDWITRVLRRGLWLGVGPAESLSIATSELERVEEPRPGHPETLRCTVSADLAVRFNTAMRYRFQLLLWIHFRHDARGDWVISRCQELPGSPGAHPPWRRE